MRGLRVLAATICTPLAVPLIAGTRLGGGNAATPGTNASSWFVASWVLGYTMLAGAINVVLITALATVGAVIYSLVTHLAGGIEVVLKETG